MFFRNRKQKIEEKEEEKRKVKHLDVLILSVNSKGHYNLSEGISYWSEYAFPYFDEFGDFIQETGYSIGIMYEDHQGTHNGTLYRDDLGDQVEKLMSKTYRQLCWAQQNKRKVRLNIETYEGSTELRIYSFDKLIRLIPKDWENRKKGKK